MLERIQPGALLLMSFLSKYDRNLLCKCRASDLKDYRANVMDVEDKEEIP